MTREQNKNRKEIITTFSNGRQVLYTTDILELLKTDNTVIEIMDKETGEILYSK